MDTEEAELEGHSLVVGERRNYYQILPMSTIKD